MFRLIISILLAGILLFIHQPAAAQELKPFTPDEMLEVENTNITGVTDNGQFVAVSSSSSQDRLGIDHFRFADPTYVQQRTSRLYVLNTESGVQNEVTDGPTVVQNSAWSPDNNTLAVILMDDQRVTLQMSSGGLPA